MAALGWLMNLGFAGSATAATTVVTMPAHGHEFFTVPNTQPHFELPAEGMPHFEVLNSQPHFELEADES